MSVKRPNRPITEVRDVTPTPDAVRDKRTTLELSSEGKAVAEVDGDLVLLTAPIEDAARVYGILYQLNISKSGVGDVINALAAVLGPSHIDNAAPVTLQPTRNSHVTIQRLSTDEVVYEKRAGQEA